MQYKNQDKTLLILDVDETLIHATDKVLSLPIDFKVFNYNVYKRPFLDEFLVAIKNHFLLALWSSASDDYVIEIANQIIPKEMSLEFIWGRSRCTYQYNSQEELLNEEIQDHYHYIKPLKKLKKKGFKLDRILIVDDSPHKSKDNFGNVIYPRAFVGNPKDVELKLLAKYLISLKDKENVRRIEKRNWQGQTR